MAASDRFDWAKEYGRGVRSGVVGDARTMGGVTQGRETFDSGVDIAQGQGDFWDYLNVLGAATALGGYGAGKGISAIDRLVATNAVKKILQNNPDVSIIAPREVMPNILSDRFKGQRELLSEQPGFDPTKYGKREDVENILFDIPLDTPDKFRPIYGAIANQNSLPQWLLERIPGKTGDAYRLFDPRTNFSGVFGNNNAVINRLPLDKVEGTFTVGDSWAPWGQYGNQVNNLRNVGTDETLPSTIIDAIRAYRADGQKLPYIEAQMSASTNPVNYISRIDVPPSFSSTWTTAALRAPNKTTVGGQTVYDPIIKKVPQVLRETRRSDAETKRFMEMLRNNETRPNIPIQQLPDILGTEKVALRQAKGRAV